MKLATLCRAATSALELGLLGSGLGAVLAIVGVADPALSLTRMRSVATPSTATSAVRGSTPCLASALDHRVSRLGL